MIKVLDLNANIEIKNNEVDIRFKGGINEELADIMSSEELEKVKEALHTISQTVGGAIERDVNNNEEVDMIDELKAFKGDLTKLKEEAYAKLSDEEKEEVDRFEKVIANMTPEEAIEYTLMKLKGKVSK